jgi:hypothetical protein
MAMVEVSRVGQSQREEEEVLLVETLDENDLE